LPLRWAERRVLLHSVTRRLKRSIRAGSVPKLTLCPLVPLERLQQHIRQRFLPRVLLVVRELAEVDFDLVALDGFFAGGGGGFECFEAFAEGFGGDPRPFPALSAGPPGASRCRQCNAVHYRVEAVSEPPSRKEQVYPGTPSPQSTASTTKEHEKLADPAHLRPHQALQRKGLTGITHPQN